MRLFIREFLSLPRGDFFKRPRYYNEWIIISWAFLVAALLIILLFLSVREARAEKLTLTWQHQTGTAWYNSECGFTVQRRKQTEASWTNVAQVNARVHTYTDNGLLGGVPYCYQLFAFNAAGQSGYSNTACATPIALDDPPPTPILGPDAPLVPCMSVTIKP